MTETNQVFIYGTLLEKFGNPFAQQLKEASSIKGTGYFHGLLFDLGGYPGAVYISKIDHKVHGHIYEVSQFEQLIKKLDDYEGIGSAFSQPNEYKRTIVPILTGTHIIPCWVYLYDQGVNEMHWIESGDYLDFLKK